MLLQRIIFRADGDKTIGLGHITRSLALADMLKKDFNIVFATQTPSDQISYPIMKLKTSKNYAGEAVYLSSQITSSDIVVLDGYFFDTTYQGEIKNKKCKIVCIDDLVNYHFEADVIINQAEGVDKNIYSAGPLTKLFSGSAYALLRQPFLQAARNTARIIETISSVFVSMGGADIHNISLKILKALNNNSEIKNIHVVIGSVNPHRQILEKYASEQTSKQVSIHQNLDASELCHIMLKCELAICPASSLSMEVCAVKMLMLSGYTAGNQKGILKGMEKKGALLNLGDLHALSEKDWEAAIEKALINKNEIEHQLNNQQAMIDGRSPERIMNIFKNL